MTSESLAVDIDGNFCAHVESIEVSGWMPKLVDTCNRQLNSVYARDVGVLRATRPLNEWMDMVEFAIGSPLPVDDRNRWVARFAIFYADFDHSERRVNEGGFIIRFIDWMYRRLQRRWFLEVFGRMRDSEHLLFPPMLDDRSSVEFRRPMLPPRLEVPSVPSVLPFHTVCR